jgi:hypothetical protein
VSAVTATGGCHCGAVRFQVQIPSFEALECNCSICAKKGFLHLIVGKDAFTLLSGEEMLSEYRFGTGTARHLFCKRCGIHAFYRPRSHPDGYDINVRCLDGDLPGRFQLTPFDGRHWEDNVGRIGSVS